MKKFSLLLLAVITLFSCSNDDENPTEYPEGKWVLTQMTGRMPNSETTGANMEWQEFYVLNGDGTFKKSRKKNGVTTEISGTYIVGTSASNTSLELTYTVENEIIGSCSSKLKEELHFQSASVLISNWQQCDGPGLKYEQLK